MQTFQIDETTRGERADVFVANQFAAYPRAALVRLFESEHILINKEPAKPGYRLRDGDTVSVDNSPLTVKIADIDLPILYEDADVLVINKPAGVISHARGRYFDEPSVASFVRQKVSSLTEERSGIVHRLDRATSGVMITAKNPEALRVLQKQFSDRKTNKTYEAIVASPLEPTEALIDVPIGRNPKKPQTFMALPDGKPAQTHYHVLEANQHWTHVELKPVTGRTHQLRIHLDYIGHPIVGDTLYGGVEAPRLMLHAKSLQITLPNGTLTTFEAPQPSEFMTWMQS